MSFIETLVQTHILISFRVEKYTVPKTAIARVTMTLNLAISSYSLRHNFQEGGG